MRPHIHFEFSLPLTHSHTSHSHTTHTCHSSHSSHSSHSRNNSHYVVHYLVHYSVIHNGKRVRSCESLPCFLSANSPRSQEWSTTLEPPTDSVSETEFEYSDVESQEDDISKNDLTQLIRLTWLQRKKAKEPAYLPLFDYSKISRSFFGIYGVTRFVIMEETQRGHPKMKQQSDVRNRQATWPFLASMPRALLYHLCAGDVMHALKTEKVPELLEIFDDGSPWERRSREKNAPAIYVRWFVDADGNSPTPKEFHQVFLSSPSLLGNWITRMSIHSPADHGRIQGMLLDLVGGAY